MEFSGQYLVKIDNISELMNLSESEYLKSIWGPKHLPLKLVLPITFVYVAIFVTGVFGNVVTCIVIRRNPVMQTATNYYLFNLAVSDLLLLILGESRLLKLSFFPNCEFLQTKPKNVIPENFHSLFYIVIICILSKISYFIIEQKILLQK